MKLAVCIAEKLAVLCMLCFSTRRGDLSNRWLCAAWSVAGTAGGVAARWRDGGKIGLASSMCRRVGSAGAARGAELPCISQRSAEFGTCTGTAMCVANFIGAPGQMPDSFQELGAECGGFLQHPGPPYNDLNHLFRRNINGTPIRLLTFC